MSTDKTLRYLKTAFMQDLTGKKRVTDLLDVTGVGN